MAEETEYELVPTAATFVIPLLQAQLHEARADADTDQPKRTCRRLEGECRQRCLRILGKGKMNPGAAESPITVEVRCVETCRKGAEGIKFEVTLPTDVIRRKTRKN